jgi:hypothetical protein
LRNSRAEDDYRRGLAAWREQAAAEHYCRIFHESAGFDDQPAS